MRVLAMSDMGPTARPLTGSGVLFFDEAGRILLVNPTYKPGLELPGGLIEPGESPADSAAREILEEIGIVAPIGRLLVADWAPAGPDDDRILFVFDGAVLDQAARDAIVLDGVEIHACGFHSRDDLDALVTPRMARRLRAAPRPPARPATSSTEWRGLERSDRSALTTAH